MLRGGVVGFRWKWVGGGGMEVRARPGGGRGRERPVFTARHADKYWCSVSSPQRAKPDSDRVIIVIIVRIYMC